MASTKSKTPNAQKIANEEAFTFDLDTRAPRYHQIFQALKDKIEAGEFADGSLLPSENEIVTLFGVSRITAKRALDEVATAGLAVREQGRGTMVRRTVRNTTVQGTVSNLAFSFHRTDNNQARVRLWEFSVQAAPDDIAADLNIAAGTMVQRAVRVWRADKGPFAHLTTYVPEEIAVWTPSDMEQLSLANLFERHGITLVKADEFITATLADPLIAQRLEVEVGTPLLSTRRRLFDQNGRVVEILSALYPPERYTYHITLNQA